jgi:hypothetical protein
MMEKRTKHGQMPMSSPRRIPPELFVLTRYSKNIPKRKREGRIEKGESGK